jgi:DnaJ-class molecular chaperone
VLENEGMPIRDSDEKGRMYVKVIVVIPEYGEEALGKLSTLFD